MKYREIEKKFVLAGVVDEKAIEKAVKPKTKLVADTIDSYWRTPGKSQFVRLRHSWGWDSKGKYHVLKEVTTKAKDKGSNLNRLEINSAINEVQSMKDLLTVVLGEKVCGEIEKTELVYFCPKHVVVSVCKIKNGRTYLEVEAPSVKLVDRYTAKILKALKAELPQEPRSLFEIYIAA